jgi:hypothetical protein
VNEIADVLKKRAAYLALAEALLAEADRVADRGTERLAKGEGLDLRSRVLTGVALKMEASFRALIADADSGRAEAMHHLKTLVESFLYFQLVVQDDTDGVAKQFLAEACDRKVRFMEKIYPVEQVQPWRDHLAVFRSEGTEPLGRNLADMVNRSHPNLTEWYRAVYALACDPAHIGDVFEFIPLPAQPTIRRGGTPLAEYHVLVALHHGLSTMISLLEALARMIGDPDDDVCVSFRAQLTAIP